MQIVQQSAPVSYAFFPERLLPAPPQRLLLAAPSVPKLLPAPKIAGLLTAGTPPPRQQKIRVDRLVKLDEAFLRELGPIRSKAEMDAEIMEMIREFEAEQRIRRAALAQRQREEREKWGVE